VLDEGDDGLVGDHSAEAQTGTEDHPGEGSTASTEEKDEKVAAEPTEKESSEDSPATHSVPPKEDSTSTNSTSDSMNGASLLRGAEVTMVDVLAMHGRAAGTVMNWYPTIINTMLTRTTTTQAAESATASQAKASEAAAAAAESATKEGDKSSHAPAEQVQLQIGDDIVVESHAQDFAQLQVVEAEEPSEQLNVGADQDSKKVFVSSTDDNKLKSQAGGGDAWRASLLVFGILTVFSCCFFAQWMAAVSKKSRLKLNKYYQRKKYEKDQLI